MPILKRAVPEACRYVPAEKIMHRDVVRLRTVESVKKIYEALRTRHHGFPITNLRG